MKSLTGRYAHWPYHFSDDGPDSIFCAPHGHCLGKHRWQLLEVLQQLYHLDTCTCRTERVYKKTEVILQPLLCDVHWRGPTRLCLVLYEWHILCSINFDHMCGWDTNPGGDYTSWLAPPVGGLYNLWWVCSWRGWWLGSRVIYNNSRSHSWEKKGTEHRI